MSREKTNFSHLNKVLRKNLALKLVELGDDEKVNQKSQ